MKTIVLVTQDQFGYQTDDYNRAIVLSSSCNVKVVCYDLGNPKIETSIEVIYVKYDSNRIKREQTIFREIKKIMLNCSENLTLYCRNFLFLPIMKCLLNKKRIRWVVDIRTGAVGGNYIFRVIYNLILTLTAHCFNEVTIISDSLAKKLKIYNYYLVPLGGKKFVDETNISSTIDEINLLYVGILDGRRIYETVLGYKEVFNKYCERIKMRYDIIGYAINDAEIKSLEDSIGDETRYNIHFHGRIINENLKPFFSLSNVGVSYIPCTEWYDVQPSTKTFEYLVNGLVCIATDTSENRQTINNKNGVMVRDSIQGFAKGLEYIINNKHSFNRLDIIERSKQYEWFNILTNSLKFLQ